MFPFYLPIPTCPICTSSQTIKNGRIHNGKQLFKCHECR
ncbi:IS1/IS1595 family N-terminal zinc-binding domain-containing protein [Microcoleus sp. POL10_C6]